MFEKTYEALGSTLWSETRDLLIYAVVLVLIESLWPAKRDQPKWRRDTRLDIAFAYLVPLIALPFYYLGLTLVIKILRGPATGGLLTDVYTYTSSQNYYLQILVAVVIADFVGYWKHRIFHSRYLWPFHAIHHSSEQVDWLSNERFHPVNSLASSLIQTLVLLVCGFGPDIAALAALIRRAHSFFEHSNVNLSYGPLSYIFVCPLFHRWHHSSDEAAIDKNYANIFSFFDLIFGTYYFPKRADPEAFGLCRARIEGGFMAHMLYPFRQLMGTDKTAASKDDSERAEPMIQE